ncbi:related to disulfide isomerase [Cephalotrichum gorgonifer]|uniref:protein disulfide-isomerase n=1 Tax=Cephalotrichum gorgonifer TaxID=2041049 RepID=A0AAE8N035_9PEZI|nr:related to disulfide isomerase [Cephalotrichum gorgonifer]
MHYSSSLISGLALLGSAQAAFYSKNSPVLQVGAKNYDRLIAKSNHTSIVEFYAPWCGHCQNLKPAYEKAATNLAGLAHVAAVDCDDDANKALCSTMGVRGFPTLKIVRPGKKTGAPMVEDYNGARTATGIVEAVVDKINNHVKRVTDKDLSDFLSEGGEERPRALLFTEKGTTSALLRSIAIDFLGVIPVGQVRSKESAAVEKFGITSFPTLVVLPGGDKEAVAYIGDMKKAPIVEFLSQFGSPNPDPAPSKSDKKAKKPKAKKSEEPAAAEEPVVVAEPEPEASEQQPPAKAQPPPIATLMTADELAKECLGPKTGTCVLALVPEEKHEGADALLETLADLVQRNVQANRALFPLYAVPAVNPRHGALVGGLKLAGEVELVAVNAKRGWWRHYEGDYSLTSVAEWVDAIRLSEGAKSKLPEGIVVEAESAETQESAKAEEATQEAHDEL